MGKCIQTRMDENEIAVLKMNDEQGGNALGKEFMEELTRAFDDLRDRGPKVLILQGLPNVFSPGGSKEILMDICRGSVAAVELPIPEKLLDLPFPVIAAMEGYAVGGGLALALCSDIVIAARESRYGATFASLGLTPGLGCTALLAEMVGPFLAAEMMFTARTFRGSELAERATNINYIVARNEVMPLAERLALRIADKDKEIIRMIKVALAARKKALLPEARLREDMMHRLCIANPDTRARIERYCLK